jgi:hypothetical protein
MGIRDPIQNRRGSGADRRSGEDRRQVSGTPANEERREVERRQEDRRRLAHGVRFATTGAVENVERWLRENCKGQWRIVLDDIDENLARKVLLVMFELPEEKQSFVAAFKKD